MTPSRRLDAALTDWMRDIIHQDPASDEVMLARINALLASRAGAIFQARFAVTQGAG